jgi:hypothetical protein
MGACFFIDSFASTVKSCTTGKPVAAWLSGIQLAVIMSSARKLIRFMLFSPLEIQKIIICL